MCTILNLKNPAFPTFILTAHCCLNNTSSLWWKGNRIKRNAILLGFLKKVTINKASSLPLLFYLSSWYLFCFSHCSISTYFHTMLDGCSLWDLISSSFQSCLFQKTCFLTFSKLTTFCNLTIKLFSIILVSSTVFAHQMEMEDKIFTVFFT